ncbi:MAG: NADP-dependent oxidoreductase [Iphinoe sp. HA4291-MV1]|jgi:NADPH:quinone reductase-like Zn-dependent oxidoreductase|nr:NADP-dependent oxidoreductase [Iphinoe sp. HA4291-MV1]
MATMKAVRIHTHGGPETLVYEDAPRSEPAADEVLIRIYAASVNPVDWKIRDGYGKDNFKHHLPLILGWDVAGTIEATGSQVEQFQLGDAVYGYTSLNRDGAYAEFMVAKTTEIALKPTSVDFVQAAAIPVGALTAWQALFDTAGLTANQRVLIHAASGGVGSMAVQLAKAKGAYVIGTASARNADFLRDLGVDEIIDYQKTKFETVVQDLDVVFDTIGGDTQERSFGVLRKDGFLVSIVSPPSQETAASYSVRSSMVSVQPNAAQLDEITALVDSGKLKPYVETVLPLSEARQAHEMSQSGRTRGKIVLQVVD